MRAKFGCDPTAGSKKVSFKFIIGFITYALDKEGFCNMDGDWLVYMRCCPLSAGGTRKATGTKRCL